jgi:hypothetical protein
LESVKSGSVLNVNQQAFCAVRQISCRIICFIHNVTYELSASSEMKLFL